jgi:putative Ca2+/H+ antiporter (TMEM165/GDT1 family)
MEAFLISLSTVALAEIGDRTQLLSLLLITRFRRPWPILAGVLCASLLSHAAASIVGVWVGARLNPTILDAAVGASMIAMALWMLKPDSAPDEETTRQRGGLFLATTVAFLVAEIGDKTQLATLALAAGYHNLLAIIAGSTCGMMLANAPVIFIGKLFANRLPMRTIHYVTCALMIVVGVLFLVRAAHH